MAQPTAYDQSHEFLTDEAANPNFPGSEIDIELNAIEITTDEILANLALIQRSDGALKNGIVTYDSLSPALRSAGLAPLSAWATATAYVVSQIVVTDYAVYKCAVSHTSSVFATDLAAGKWTLLAELPQGEQGEQGEQGILGVWRGAWTTGTAYALNDAVSEGGSSYLCIDAHTSGTFATDLAAEKWSLIAQKGDTGPQGETGLQGPQGETGEQGPQGNTGAQGDTGPQGDQGAVGNTGATGAGYTATSTSSQTIGSSGTKTFTVAAGLAYTAGARVRAADSSAPGANWMEGVVSSYSGTTLVFIADLSAGSGTKSSWNINLTGQQGATGDVSISGTFMAGNFPVASGSTELEDSGFALSSFVAALSLNQSSLYTLGSMLAVTPDSGGVQDGKNLIVNGQRLGQFDYIVKNGNQTVSSFSSGDWFSATNDKGAAVVVKGNLTINSGQVFKPSARKLYTLLYVTGDLTVNGEISMSARGANHSATGTSVTAAAIKIIAGTHGGVTDPQVPAAGGAGGLAVANGGAGTVGSAGTAGATGGGGSGGNHVATGFSSGQGADGSSFGGGPGGGGLRGGAAANAGAGNANGGAGGAAVTPNGGGGAGNPGGALGGTGSAGSDGTGGVLVIICLGGLSGSGTITANGAGGGAASNGGAGGSSGGGSVTVLYGADSSSITPAANGGVGGNGGVGQNGGAGGVGTARKLELAL